MVPAAPRLRAGIVAAAAALLLLLVAPSAAELTRVEHPPKTEGSLAILAVGDWGRKGQFNQTLVAQQVTDENSHHAYAHTIYNMDHFSFCNFDYFF